MWEVQRSMRYGHVVEGVVREAEWCGDGLWRLIVDAAGRARRALLYEQFTPPAAVGDAVALNTTAVDMGLGTGGYDFVVHVVGKRRRSTGQTGHIMKLRYTPLQTPVMAVEEQDSPHHDTMKAHEDVAGLPVVVTFLHSQVAPAAAALRLALGPNAVISYVMTDGAALPIAFSDIVRRLVQHRVVDNTITVGHALGGDVEAVTLFSGLLAARWVLLADAAVVAMGPGVVGTGTSFGTTAVEVGHYADAASVVGARVFVAPRLGFADPRERHVGVSHHVLTALGRVAQRRCTVVLPQLDERRRQLVLDQLRSGGITDRHDVMEEARGSQALDYLTELGVELRSMGRGRQEEGPLFLAAAAAGYVAADAAGNPLEN